MTNVDILLEHETQRILNEGIMPKDYVKIIKTKVEHLSGEHEDVLKGMVKSDLNICVLSVRGTGRDVSVLIGQEITTGLYQNKIEVPVCCVEVISKSFPPSIPNSWKVEVKQTKDGKPEILNKDGKFTY